VEFKNYYQTLGLEQTATADDIKKAFRRLARKHHPDLNKNADAQSRMQELNEAKNVLGNPDKRAAYDRLLARRQDGQDFEPPPDWHHGFADAEHDGFHDYDMADPSDFFANLFSQARHQQGRPRRGKDLHASISLSLAESYHESQRNIVLPVWKTDTQGQVYKEERTLSVRIPKGVTEGQHIRLAGQGSPGQAGDKAGELYLEVHFIPDPQYRVEGRQVFQTLPVTPWEAALGGVIHVATPSGLVKVTLPQSSQNGRKIRLKGRGIPGQPDGDLYLVLAVILPSATSPSAQALYQQMARELAFDPRQSSTKG